MRGRWCNLVRLCRVFRRPFFFFLLGAVLLALALPCSSVGAEKTDALIERITFAKEGKNRESVSFKLNGHYIPQMSAMEGNANTPKLVFDFLNTRHSSAVKGIVKSQGDLIVAIRTGMHTDPLKTRVVVDLVAAKGYDFSHEFQAKDNILKITIFHAPEKNGKKSSPNHEKLNVAQSDAKSAITTPAPVPTITHSEAIKKEEPPVNAGVKEQKKESSPKPPSVIIPSSAPPEPQITTAPSSGQTMIHDISLEHTPDKGDTIRMQVSNFKPPTVFGMEEPQSSIICDFQNAAIGNSIQELLPLQGEYVRQIRVKKDAQGQKIRIILELIPKHSYDLKQVFYKEDGLFVFYIKAATKEKF